jgi:hypothetical protein
MKHDREQGNVLAAVVAIAAQDVNMPLASLKSTL